MTNRPESETRERWYASKNDRFLICGDARDPAARHDILDFLREFSPLGVCDDGIGGVLMIRSRVSVDVAGLFQEFGRDSNVAVSMFSVI